MNRRRGLIICLILLCLAGCGWKTRAVAAESNGGDDRAFIAHALGGIDGFSYTNSYEAFMNSYLMGYRLFEADLILTSDGELAARHDWSGRMQPGLADPPGRPPTLPEFKTAPILGKYRPLDMNDLIRLLARYPDISLITDTKETDTSKVKRQFEYLVSQANAADPSLLQRIIPEIYSPEMYDTVMKIYPFPNKIYSLYQSNASEDDILAYVKEKPFTFVAMPVSRILRNPTLVHRLNRIGARSYVHTVNNTLFMGLLGRLGVYGFYTDAEAAPSSLLSELRKPIDRDMPFYMILVILGCIIGHRYGKIKRRSAWATESRICR
ncbi:phosphatidylinositol-specific phospholipase C/glycerophosphodiester phosphodiesterase family protein [Cohnella nanjingensis]|uniref:Glycerophosphodiester phosphodiesterase n=1 Tax=Cohnella nanjingensis TaxID=1387779 RepID=A0A7X0VFG7_9BACL|nr:phosphatidylinositol-specific phospholipase C/glycerophosphodiester phosphodiesterase family protein [Cohnella nanjingensis]MBB6672022.1 glycerophosphodiester phosphodiesterase [Cohnella nanjingensis]